MSEVHELSQTYYKRRLKANRIKRLISARKAQIRTFRVFLRLIMIVGIIAFGISVLRLPQWILDVDSLKVPQPWVLKIEGNAITPTYKIVDMIRQTDVPTTRIYKLDTREIVKNISALEPVKKVYVRRFWLPARLLVVIEERVPVFEITPSYDSLPTSAITSDGVFIGRDYMPLSRKFHTIKIISPDIHANGQKWSKERVGEFQKFSKAIETFSSENVEYIDLREPKDIYVKLDSVLVRFGEINESVFERAKWLATIIPETKNFKQKIKYIDLRWEEAHYIKLDGSELNGGEKDEETAP